MNIFAVLAGHGRDGLEITQAGTDLLTEKLVDITKH